MKRAAIAMFLTGAATSYFGVLTAQQTPASRTAQLVLATILLAGGAVIAVSRSSPTVMGIAVFCSISVLSAMMATADPIGSTAFFYLWPVLFAAYFCTRRLVIAAVAYLGVTLLAAMFITSADVVKSDAFISTMAAVGIIAALVSIMRERELILTRRLEQAAHTDPLTGLLNRRALDPDFARLVDQARVRGTALTAVMFDLDHFKRFNDAHGHHVGDEALRRTAFVLRSQSRPGDLVARIGGEEFAVVLPGATLQDAIAYAERVGVALGQERITDGCPLSTSAGIAACESPADSSASLLSRADQSLYAAKASGRCRAAWWDGQRTVVGDRIQSAANETQRLAA